MCLKISYRKYCYRQTFIGNAIRSVLKYLILEKFRPILKEKKEMMKDGMKEKKVMPKRIII